MALVFCTLRFVAWYVRMHVDDAFWTLTGVSNTCLKVQTNSLIVLSCLQTGDLRNEATRSPCGRQPPPRGATRGAIVVGRERLARLSVPRLVYRVPFGVLSELHRTILFTIAVR